MDKLTSMQVFEKVAKHNSFSAAAENMGLSKAMVSKHIASLENSLDVLLLNRTTRRLSLTESGVAYLERIKHILADIEETELAVSKLSSEPRGTLKLTAPTSFGSFHLARAISGYQRIYPDVQIEMVLTERLYDLVEDRFDLAIHVGHLDDSSLVAKRLASARMVVCGSPAYFKKYGIPETPEDLVDHKCLIFSPRTPANEWSFKKDNKQFHVRVSGDIRSNIGDALRIASMQDSGLIQLPTYMTGLDIKAGRLQVVLEDYEPPESPINA
ncbi:MAG: LysR family transcriptional regulator, partial [Proteobacteria bacterium]|nr:LysR family transcriptional regulator [Pseudomonadota bacterium]